MASKSEKPMGSAASGAQANALRSDSLRALARDDDSFDDVTWRFRRTDCDMWRWQKIAVGESVNLESSTTFPSYEACVADAASAGYAPLMRSSHLVSLTLSQNPQPIPALLSFNTLEEGEGPVLTSRSPVLKKRVAHPAIEKVFGKGRAPASTRKRTSPSRAALSAGEQHARTGSRIPGKIKISRA